MAIREGAWDCPYCDRKLNRGGHAFCGTCGAPRDKEVKFYLPEGARLVEDEAELKRAASGPDWSCQFCQAENPGYQNFCTGCGGGADGSPPRATSVTMDETQPVAAAGPATKADQNSSGRTSRLVPFLAVATIVVVALLYFFFRTSAETGTVAALSWERTIGVDRLETRTDEKWDDQVPRNARILSRRNEIHSHRKIQTGSETRTRTVQEKVQTGTRQVKVGTKDLGNGYFEDIMKDEPIFETVSREETYQEPIYREEPIYRDKVRYEFDEWRQFREEKAQGREELEPHWPEVQVTGPKEREGKRTERYYVEFGLPEGRIGTYETASQNEWSRYQKGQSYKLQVRGDKVVKIEAAE